MENASIDNGACCRTEAARIQDAHLKSTVGCQLGKTIGHAAVGISQQCRCAGREQAGQTTEDGLVVVELVEHVGTEYAIELTILRGTVPIEQEELVDRDPVDPRVVGGKLERYRLVVAGRYSPTSEASYQRRKCQAAAQFQETSPAAIVAGVHVISQHERSGPELQTVGRAVVINETLGVIRLIEQCGGIGQSCDDE